MRWSQPPCANRKPIGGARGSWFRLAGNRQVDWEPRRNSRARRSRRAHCSTADPVDTHYIRRLIGGRRMFHRMDLVQARSLYPRGPRPRLALHTEDLVTQDGNYCAVAGVPGGAVAFLRPSRSLRTRGDHALPMGSLTSTMIFRTQRSLPEQLVVGRESLLSQFRRGTRQTSFCDIRNMYGVH